MTMEKFPAIGASWARAESFMRSKRNALAAYASGVYMGRLLIAVTWIEATQNILLYSSSNYYSAW